MVVIHDDSLDGKNYEWLTITVLFANTKHHGKLNVIAQWFPDTGRIILNCDVPDTTFNLSHSMISLHQLRCELCESEFNEYIEKLKERCIAFGSRGMSNVATGIRFERENNNEYLTLIH